MSELDNEYPISRMNSDDEDRRVPKGEYRYALNVRNGTPYIKKGGTATNTKGNTLIPTYLCPYNGNVFPAGRNRTLGYFEDTIKNTVIFCNWNSAGNHGIYRWYKDKTDSNNPYGIVEQIIQYNFRWKQNERITSLNYVVSTTGDLLYWCDSTGLHKINLDRANINGKPKSWRFIFPKTNPFTSPSNFRFVLRDFNNNLIVDVNFPVGSYATLALALDYLVEAINSTYGTFMTAEACGCEMKVTEIGTSSFNYEYLGTYQTVIIPRPALPCLMVADNWYGNLLTDRMFDRVPFPPLNAPSMEYKQDTNTLFNNVKNLVFQSRLLYNYYDYEDSVTGVVSQIATNNLNCSGQVNLNYNYIDINFEDTQIPIATTLVILNQIHVLVRQGNTGNWRDIISLDPCDFLDYNYTTETWFCHYEFYNNILGVTVANEVLSKLESGVPILANAEIFNSNRMVTGGITKGRNAPDCAEGDFTIEFQDSEEPLFDVTVHARIYNPLADNIVPPNIFPNIGITERMGAIYQRSATPETGKAYAWGGVGVSGTFIGNDILDDANGNMVYEQYAPAKGLIGYLVGTDYLGISRQIQVLNGVEGNYLPTVTDTGVIDCTTGYNDLKAFISLASVAPYNGSDLFQRITIKNVPAGRYIFRLASHWCSEDDVLGKGSMYNLNNGQLIQKTSTHTFCTNEWNGTGFVGNQRKSEISFEITNADVFLGEILVEDVCNITRQSSINANKRAFFDGYLYDANGSVTISELSQSGTSMELQWVNLNGRRLDRLDIADLQTEFYTDHNGYFYMWYNSDIWNGSSGVGYSFRAYGVTFPPSVNPIVYCTAADLYYVSASNSVLDGLVTLSLQPQTINTDEYLVNAVSYSQVLVANNSLPATNKMKTFLVGDVLSTTTGAGVQDVLVILENGKFRKTNINGEYEIPVWADSKAAHVINSQPPVYFTNSAQGRFGDALLFNNYICQATLSTERIFPLAIPAGFINTNSLSQEGIPPYSPTSKYLVQDVFITLVATTIGKALKRGGTVTYTQRWYDIQGRVSTCAKLYEIYIPFQTENLKNFPYVRDPATGLPYTTDTYISGRPIIKWSIPAQAPEYAAFTQLMRTKNTFQGRYLQWVADGAVYLSEVATGTTVERRTTYQSGDAVAVKISLDNIITYQAQNPTSQIGYAFVPGDRIRFIKDRDGVLLQGLYDFEIASFDAQTSSLIVATQNIPFEILSGFTIEVYQPKTLDTDETQIIYEVGEVFKCTNPGFPDNQHSVTSGTFTNGDTYWRGNRIPVLDSVSGFAAIYPQNMESASVSNFYPSLAEDIGRIGLIDPNLRELYYPSRLIVSDTFQPDTASNGLSSFSPFNTKDMGKQYGAVSRLFMNGKTLYAFLNNSQVSNYIGVLTLQYSQAQTGIQVTSDEYLGTQNPSVSYLGTDLPAAMAQKDGYFYGAMSIRSSVWRYANDGYNEISRNTYQSGSDYRTRMVTYFKELCDTGIWDGVSIFDRRYNEYILTLWKTATANSTFIQGIEQTGIGTLATVRVNSVVLMEAGDVISVTYTNSITGQKITKDVTVESVTYLPTIPQSTNIQFYIPEGQIVRSAEVILKYRGEGKTIAWNEEKNGWTTEYSFLPECYAALGDNTLSFKDGKIWIHDTNELYNNFYGVQYNLKVFPIFNDKPDEVKVWNAIWCMFYQDDNRCNFFSDRVYNNNGQLSRLKASNFVKREEFWYVPMARDITDVTVSNPVINGRNMRSTSLVVEFENNHTGAVNIFGFRANTTKSERTSR